jgi:hypothetical protein
LNYVISREFYPLPAEQGQSEGALVVFPNPPMHLAVPGFNLPGAVPRNGLNPQLKAKQSGLLCSRAPLGRPSKHVTHRGRLGGSALPGHFAADCLISY